ncbi:hypothetical protein D1007_57089 [Hordeum vulgare]|nr:hypothetical protein D1007_57089 [Hordeum vulgare]
MSNPTTMTNPPPPTIRFCSYLPLGHDLHVFNLPKILLPLHPCHQIHHNEPILLVLSSILFCCSGQFCASQRHASSPILHLVEPLFFSAMTTFASQCLDSISSSPSYQFDTSK